MSQPFSFEPEKEKRQLRRLIIATTVGFFALLFVVVGIGCAYSYLSTRSEDVIQAVSRKTGLPIKVGEKTVGLKKIDFKDISIGGRPSTFIDSVSVTTDISNAKVGDLTIYAKKLNVSTDQLGKLSTLVLPKTGLTASLPLPSTSRRALPKTVNIKLPEVLLWDKGQVLARIKGVTVSFDEGKQRGKIEFASVALKGKPFLPAGVGTVTGSLKSGDMKIRIQNRKKDVREQFVLSVDGQKSNKEASVQIRARNLNWSAFPFVSKHVINHRVLPIAFNANVKLGRSNDVLVSWSGATGKASLMHKRIAKHALYPLILRSSGQLAIKPKTGDITVYKSQMSAGSSTEHLITMTAGLKTSARRQYITGYVNLPKSSCQKVMSAMPHNAGDLFRDFKAPQGAIGGTLRFKVNTAKPDKFVYKISNDVMSCKFRSEQPEYSRTKLIGSKPVISSFQLANAYVSEYPYTAFTPLKEVPPQVRNAFLISEDAGFYKHNGFSVSTFESAVRRNISEGRAALGASTITMQTAKNLWLSSEKTVLRKLQEALLTMYLEDVLMKDRILEIYMNIVEFGPGIYGISSAADHFFGKEVHDLNVLEGIYLASLLPSPVRRYTYFCRGYVTPNYRNVMNQKLDWMLQFKRIDDQVYQAAKRARLVFDVNSRRDAQYCPSGSLRYSSRDATN